MRYASVVLILVFAASGVFGQAGGGARPGGGASPGGAAPGGGTAPTGAPGAARMASRPAQELPESIGVVEIAERVFTATVGGRLRPANTVSHPATVTGLVSGIRVVVGQHVRAGDPLFTVERDDAAGSYAPVVMRSRIAGIVTAVQVRQNNEIRSGENGVSVIDTSEYLLTAQISDKDAFSVPVGRPVTANGTNGAAVEGVLVARSPEPDYQTGLFTLTFRFPGSDSIFPGQFMTVDLPVETVRGVFIAQNLLVRRYGRFYVWTVAPDNTLQMREVTTGRTHGTDIEIRSGLHPGDHMLLQRRGNEREGMAAPGTGL